mmetsp:Transcript_6018/g.11810  ORF Transcript_6018/g.11810 Transcript_6018/m.11810 type:complete len:153 (+) Transcript_6018:333-791(+)
MFGLCATAGAAGNVSVVACSATHGCAVVVVAAVVIAAATVAVVDAVAAVAVADAADAAGGAAVPAVGPAASDSSRAAAATPSMNEITQIVQKHNTTSQVAGIGRRVISKTRKQGVDTYALTAKERRIGHAASFPRSLMPSPSGSCIKMTKRR